MDCSESGRETTTGANHSIPSSGECIEYNGEFRSPDSPVVPVAHGIDEEVVRATQQILDTAVERLGREIHWLRTYIGDAARERNGNPVPDETVSAFQKYRIGLLGTPATPRQEALRLETELQKRVGLGVAFDHRSSLAAVPSPLCDGRDIEVAVVRDLTPAVEYEPATPAASDLEVCLDGTAPDPRPAGPTGYSVSPISKQATESLVDTAMEQALAQDLETVTLVHESDRRPDSEGAFRDWARDFLAAEYDEAYVPEQQAEANLDDEVVLRERQTDALCEELVSRPSEHDLLVAPASSGRYLSAIAGAVTGTASTAPGLVVGEGRCIASPSRTPHQNRGVSDLIGTILSGCLLCERIGWADIAAMMRAAVTATLADGINPPGIPSLRADRTAVTVDEFANAVIECLAREGETPGDGGVHTTPSERAEIRQLIAGLYNIVFEDQLSPRDIELNQLLAADEEADIYLPEVGLNFYYWRQWSTERRLEVLLHELAHVDEADGERDHGEEFYERFVDLVEIATDWHVELEALFGSPIDLDRLAECLVDSVHEETIEPDLETVESRQAWLRKRLDIGE